MADCQASAPEGRRVSTFPAKPIRAGSLDSARQARVYYDHGDTHAVDRNAQRADRGEAPVGRACTDVNRRSMFVETCDPILQSIERRPVGKHRAWRTCRKDAGE